MNYLVSFLHGWDGVTRNVLILEIYILTAIIAFETVMIWALFKKHRKNTTEKKPKSPNLP